MHLEKGILKNKYVFFSKETSLGALFNKGSLYAT
jgi:hypothetical protein